MGNHDLILSKRFDVDGDGRLNTGERKNAENAIAKGIEGKYLWGLEANDASYSAGTRV